MKGLYRKLSPFTPDSSGATALFADLPALVIPLDMNGTVSTFRNRVGVLDQSGVRVCSALGFRETSYVLGDVDGCVEECLDLAGRFPCEFVVLVSGPVSSMVGIDLGGIARRVEEETGKRVVAVDCSGNEPYDKGLSKALMAVFEDIEARGAWERADAPRRGVNIVGLNRIDHNEPRTCELLRAAVARSRPGGVVSVWGCMDGWNEWERAGAAAENVIVSNCGVGLAKAMQRKWGTPYRFVDDLGIGLHDPWTPDDRLRGLRVLVVHEQTTANLVRSELEGLGCSVDVGCFHAMRKERRRAGDLRFGSERDFERLVRERSYGCVVGDPALAACLPPRTQLVEFGFSAISNISLGRSHGPVTLSPEWFEKVRGEIRSCTLGEQGRSRP